MRGAVRGGVAVSTPLGVQVSPLPLLRARSSTGIRARPSEGRGCKFEPCRAYFAGVVELADTLVLEAGDLGVRLSPPVPFVGVAEAAYARRRERRFWRFESSRPHFAG